MAKVKKDAGKPAEKQWYQKPGFIALGVIIVIVLILVISVISAYNSFVALGQGVDAQWANVETQYQRRVDLIPNLVSTVQGYAAYEASTLEELSRLRTQWQTAPDVNAKIETANQLESAISKLLLVAENYPDLKANQNFLALQDELAGTENRISVERTRFNEKAKAYNTAIKKFPGNLIASMFGFVEKKYFQAAPGAETVPQVKF